MEAAAHLTLVDPATGEVHQPDSTVRDLEDKVAGLLTTIQSQARKIGTLERQLVQDDPTHHPKAAEMKKIVERWRRATGHPKARISKDRLDLVRARLKDEYTFDQIALAVDGLAAFAYVRSGKRVREGSPAERHDRLGIALGGGEPLEKFAVLGHEARKQGLITWEDEA